MKKKYLISGMGLLEILVTYLAFCISTISYRNELFVYMAVGLFGVVSFIYFEIFQLTYRTPQLQNYFRQIHLINIVAGSVLLGIFLRNLKNTHFPGCQKVIIFLLLIATVVCEVFYIYMNGFTGVVKISNQIGLILKHNWILCLVILLFVILSPHLGGTTYKWDSNLYYITCWELDAFSISNLAIYGHIAQTFGLLMKLGTVLLGDVAIAAYGMNVFVAICGIVAFYRIVKYVSPKANNPELFLATGAYAFSAYSLGLVNYLSLDYYCACLFPMVVYYMLTKKWIFHIISAFLFCFTKEPAIIIYAGLCMIYLVSDEMPAIRKEGLKHIKHVFISMKYWYMLTVGVLWYVTYRLLGPWSAGEGGIGFDSTFVWNKIKVMYIMNFGWFFSLLCVIAIIVSIRKKEKNSYGIYKYLVGSLLTFSVFSCIFRTANHYRYNAITMFCICCISMTYILSLKKKYIRRIVLGISCVVSLSSVYLSLDPISNLLFDTVSTGNGYVWSTRGDPGLADSAIYNKQMLGAENVLNCAFRDAIDNGDLIILQAQNSNIWYADGLTDFSQMSNENQETSFFWDDDLHQRVNVENTGTKKIDMVQVKGIRGIEQSVVENDLKVTYSYVAISDTSNGVFDEIKNRYSVLEDDEYQYANWRYRRIRFRENDLGGL